MSEFAIPDSVRSELESEFESEGVAGEIVCDEVLEKAIERNASKYIWSQAYDSGAKPGQDLRHIIYLRNPLPKYQHNLNVTFFIGFPNPQNIWQSWVNRDTRWRDWTSPPFSLAGGTQKHSVTCNHLIPDVPPSNYVSIAVLWRSGLGMEAYLDCSFVSLQVLPK